MVTVMTLAMAWAVEVPFETPATVPLFTALGTVEAKASASGDACDEAMADAMEAVRSKAERAGLSELLTVALTEDGCKQSRTGDTVLTSVVSLKAVAIAPGEGLAPVTLERTLAMAAILGAQAGGGLDAATLMAVDGGAWVDLGEVELTDLGGGPGARAARAFEDELLPQIATWGPILATLPEVSGVAMVALGEGKGKKREAIRFRVRTDAIAGWRRGDYPDEVLLERSSVERAPEGKERVYAALQLDLGEAAHADSELREVDMNDADLEGLEDEEPAAP